VVKGLKDPIARRAALLDHLPGEGPVVLARAPGRVNLIGEHTDYNDGYVLPLALGVDTWVAARARGDRRVSVHSVEMGDTQSFELDAFERDPARGWADYVKAVCWAFEAAGLRLGGMDLAVHGRVPQGAGLSSSAALELALARAFAALNDWKWDPAAMARLCQRAENGFIGVQCGIMDQMASAAASSDAALLLDCRSLQTRSVPLRFPSAEVVVVHSGVRRGLEHSQYNERRQACEAAVAALKERKPDIQALRDLSMEELLRWQRDLSPLSLKRARHVVGENARVLEACAALERGDAPAFGALMNASHRSLAEDYEVSSPELDALVAASRSLPGVHGARLTGAGFGGCTVHLIEKSAAAEFGPALLKAYKAATGLEASLVEGGAAGPAGLL
jgi:galactokinase